MCFVHHISLRKALYDVKNEIARKTTWNWLYFYIKKGRLQDDEDCSFLLCIMSKG